MKKRKLVYLIVGLALMVIVLILYLKQIPNHPVEKGLMNEAELHLSVDKVKEALGVWYTDLATSPVDWNQEIAEGEMVFAQSLMSETFEPGTYAVYDFVKDGIKLGYVLVESETGKFVEAGEGVCPVHRIKEKVLALDEVEFFYMVYQPVLYNVCIKSKGNPNWGYYDELGNRIIKFEPPIKSLSDGKSQARNK